MLACENRFKLPAAYSREKKTPKHARHVYSRDIWTNSALLVVYVGKRPEVCLWNSARLATIARCTERGFNSLPLLSVCHQRLPATAYIHFPASTLALTTVAPSTWEESGPANHR